MSKVQGNAVQLGESATASQNLTITANGDGTFTLARGNVGATTQDLLTIDASGNVLFPADSNLLGKGYTSSEQTITSAGLLTLPHGLGTKPSLVQVTAVCKVAEGGYSVGDEVVLNNATYSTAGTNQYGLTIKVDATNLYVRMGSGASVLLLLDGSGVQFGATNTSWNLVVRAWK